MHLYPDSKEVNIKIRIDGKVNYSFGNYDFNIDISEQDFCSAKCFGRWLEKKIEPYRDELIRNESIEWGK
jgi:hypothetical protein